jgi:hypothetical protein
MSSAKKNTHTHTKRKEKEREEKTHETVILSKKGKYLHFAVWIGKQNKMCRGGVSTHLILLEAKYPHAAIGNKKQQHFTHLRSKSGITRITL